MSANLRTRAALAAGIMLGGMTMLLPGVALSQSATPGNITGRWSFVANTTIGTLNITQFPNNTISGSIAGRPGGLLDLEGYYNPSSRRIVFLINLTEIRNAITTPTPIEFYSGWISGDGLSIGGQFSIWKYSPVTAPSQGIDYNFSATKVSDFP